MQKLPAQMGNYQTQKSTIENGIDKYKWSNKYECFTKQLKLINFFHY